MISLAANETAATVSHVERCCSRPASRTPNASRATATGSIHRCKCSSALSAGIPRPWSSESKRGQFLLLTLTAALLNSGHAPETPQPNLCMGMKWLLGTFTQRWNRRRQAWGHLFGDRYKAQCIDERSPEYLRTACDYVHLNPARAGLVRADETLETYSWSSYPAYLPPRLRPERRCRKGRQQRRRFPVQLHLQRRGRHSHVDPGQLRVDRSAAICSGV